MSFQYLISLSITQTETEFHFEKSTSYGSLRCLTNKMHVLSLTHGANLVLGILEFLKLI